MPATWLITGSSRGIGYGIVKQLSSDANNVIFASCRDPSGASQLSVLAKDARARIHLVKLATDSEDSIKSAAGEVGELISDARLDYLVNNAASQSGRPNAFQITPDAFGKDMTTNVLGPALVAQAFLPFLERSSQKNQLPVVVNMSSGMGSIGRNPSPTVSALYSMTKAALNMLTFKQSASNKNIVFIALNPGWVKTDMGGQGAPCELEEGVEKILKVITNSTAKDSGHFKNHDGGELAW